MEIISLRPSKKTKSNAAACLKKWQNVPQNIIPWRSKVSATPGKDVKRKSFMKEG